MFDALLKSKFYTKCKSAIKLTKTRTQMIKRKRNAMVKYLKIDVSDLLKNGLDTNAYGRVEGLWNELNLSNCYDFVENFCVHISSHLAALNKQRECPEECREAVSSLMFAAARFADLPELRELRTVFTERYGNSIECYANKEFVNKLKATSPTKDMKLQLMKDIALEFGIEWNSKALEQKQYNLSAPGHDRDKNGKFEESISKTMDDAAEDILNKGAGHKHEHQREFMASERESNSPKKREKVTHEGKHRNYQSYEGTEDCNYIRDALADRVNRKQQQKHENLKGFSASEREVEEVSSHGRKELTGDENNLPTRREKVVAEGKHPCSPYEGANNKHVGVDRSHRKEQRNELQALGGTSREEDDEKPFYYKPFHPPYTKPRTSNLASSLTVPPTSTDNEVPEHSRIPDHIDSEDHRHQGNPNGKVKPVPKSVRRRFLKPQPIPDQEGEKQREQQRKVLDHDPSDEEESKLDWLLQHYSKRKSASNGGKLEPVIKRSPPAAADNSTGRHMENTGKDGPPPRTASLPNEPSSAETPRKVHARAASFQAEHCHVHPKLPDYDDFVARLAALQGKLE